MNLAETSQLLTTASAIDRRERTLDEIQAWQIVLADIPLSDALAALRAHFADPERGLEFLKPAHITKQLTAARPTVQLPPRADEGMCPVHEDYPLDARTGCAACRRHPADLEQYVATGTKPAQRPLGPVAELLQLKGA